MALIIKDRVQETSNTTGTGTLTLNGAVTGFQSFASAIGNGNTTYYGIYANGYSDWEVGVGTVSYTGGVGYLARTTVLASSNAGSLVNFTEAQLSVWGDMPAAKGVYQDANGLVTVPVLNTTSTTSTTANLTFNASNSGFTSGASVANSYLQAVLQNSSGTSGASTNYVLSNDLGTDSSYYGEFGMNSSVYSGSSTPVDFFSINNGIYFSGHDGDITVGSGNGKKLYLAWGTTGQSAHVINVSGAIGLNTNLASGTGSGTTNFGTAGQVLTSAGSGATPTWQTPTTGTVTSITSSTLTVTGTSAIPTVNLTSGIVTAGTTGSSTLIPVVTVDTYGRVTAISTASNPQGTVTSVSGTGTVNGISLSGTVTSSGSLTLGGTIDLTGITINGGSF